MKTFILLIFMCMILSNLVVAAQDSLGTYKQDDCVDLLQICGTCSYSNVTSVIQPNSTKMIIDEEMFRRGAEYNYTFCETDLAGIYLVNGVADLDGTANAWAYEFLVTPSGLNLTEDNVILYTFAIILMFLLSIFFIFLSFKLQEPGFKIFFMVLCFIFIFASLATTLMTIRSTGVSETVQDIMTTATVISAIVLIIIGYWVMINVTRSSLELFKIRKGIY